MSMLRALAAVGGAAAVGYQQGTENLRKRKQEDEDRAWQNEQRDRQRKEWGDADAEKQRVANAAQDVAPVEIKETKPDTMDNRDVGQPGEQALPTAGYDVQGQRFTDQAQATKAAAAQNTDQGRATRMAKALDARSPERAMQLRSAARQGEAADLQIGEARQKAADTQWDRDLAGVSSLDDLSKLLSDSHGDMTSGKTRVKALPNADGKTFDLHRVNPDGSTTPSGNSFANLDEARMMLSKRVTPEQRLAHYEGIRRYNETLKLHQDEAQARLKHQDRMASIAERGAKAQERTADLAATPRPITPESTFDIKTATSQAQDRIKALREERLAAGKPLTAKEEAAELQNTIAAYKQVHVQKFVEQSINSSLTASKADPQAYAADYQTALQLGASPQMLAAMGHQPPPGMNLPAGAPGTSAVQPAAAPAPAQPSTLTRMGQAVSSAASEAQQQGGEYQELQRRVALASSGKYKLSAREIALARQYGIGIPG